MIEYAEDEFRWFVDESINAVCNPTVRENVLSWHPVSRNYMYIKHKDGKVTYILSGYHVNIEAKVNDYEIYGRFVDEQQNKYFICEKQWRLAFVHCFIRLLAREYTLACRLAARAQVPYGTLCSYTKRYVVPNNVNRLRTPSLYTASKLVCALRVPLSELYARAHYNFIDISKTRSFEEWNVIIDKLRVMYPYIYDNAERWFPVLHSYDEMVIHLENGDVFAIDIRDLTCTLIYSKKLERPTEKYDPNTKYYVDYIDEDTWRERFSSLFIHLLHKKRISQFDLARAIGVTRTTINRYANGKSTPSLYHATMMARYLKCTLTDFYVLW